ncbi:glycine-rich protein 1-like [Iris pallida]|uniref:Glycine-rich protein 1-like n=1 Tax=Iris pallida TaxID=29817 RepID=A0AAX6G361_IRIPA|nr:glycine-rich protein 1-like [Iris pallida]
MPSLATPSGLPPPSVGFSVEVAPPPLARSFLAAMVRSSPPVDLVLPLRPHLVVDRIWRSYLMWMRCQYLSPPFASPLLANSPSLAPVWMWSGGYLRTWVSLGIFPSWSSIQSISLFARSWRKIFFPVDS